MTSWLRCARILRPLTDLIFVPHCPACDAIAMEVGAGAGLCVLCAESLYPLGPACPRCAEPYESGPVTSALLCTSCRRAPPPFQATYAAYRFGGELAGALRRLKYDRRADIARTLAPLMAPVVRLAAQHAEVAVPMPLHWRRFSRRTFNQADLLLRHALAPSDLIIDRLSLRRVRATRPQSSMKAAQRARNVAAAFAVCPRRRHRISGRRVALVDDVMTTGATMAAASHALLAAGARSVVAVCVARAES